MMRTPAALVTLLVSAAAMADDAGLRRCRDIADAQRRLACYDALPLGPAAPAASPKAGAPAAAAPPSAPAREGTLLERFGFEQRQQPDELATVESTIPGRFEGWTANQHIRLANGQVWQITDGSSRRAWVENPKVTIRRGLLGSFFLDIEGINPAPRVRRVQ